MISANLLVLPNAIGHALDLLVHLEPQDSSVSITRGRTQDNSIRVCVYSPSSGRIRRLGQIGRARYSGALGFRDNLSGAPQTIPVYANPNSGGGA